MFIFIYSSLHSLVVCLFLCLFDIKLVSERKDVANGVPKIESVRNKRVFSISSFSVYFEREIWRLILILFGLVPIFCRPPIFFPLRTPICVPRGSTLEVHFWRFNDSEKVAYASLALFHCISLHPCIYFLFMLFISISLRNLKQVWYEWCVTSPSVTPIHNVNGCLHWLKL